MLKIHKQHISELEDKGYCLVKGFIQKENLEPLQQSLNNTQNSRFCLNTFPELLPIARDIYKSLSDHHPQLHLNRSLLFNKTSQKNWSVLWHQDLTICVKEKHDAEGYGPWSVKEGIPHVQPPLNILNSMITARLHIDDSNEENGPLQVIPYSHQTIHNRESIDRLKAKSVVVTAQKGDLLLMKPLLLHASSSSLDQNKNRRVLHLEFLPSFTHSKLELFHPRNFL